MGRAVASVAQARRHTQPYVVRNPNARQGQLALSVNLVGRHGSLDMEFGAYRDSMRRLFASCLDLPASPVLAVDGPFSGVPIALVPP